MKLLDQYILKRFSIPLVYCLAAFSMIFVVVDLFDHLSDFIEARASLFATIWYYVELLPTAFIYIVPVSLLLAILYSLWQLTRHNELTAMRASGIGHLRIMMPILCIAFCACFAVALVQEKFVPACVYNSIKFIRSIKNPEQDADRFAVDLSYKNEAFHRIWTIGRYDRQTAIMEQVKVIQETPAGSELETIHAKTAEWQGDAWLFQGVTVQQFSPERQITNTYERALLKPDYYRETPRDFHDEIMMGYFDRNKDQAIFSIQDLRRILLNRRQMAERDRRRYMVEFHFRLSMPWTCLIVSIFAVPCGIQTGRRGALYGIIFAILTFFCFYILLSFSMWLGKNGSLPPLASAWLPNLTVLGLGLLMLRRLR